MLQTVDGREVYVVEFDTLPEMPITWSTPEERPYAQILAQALKDGLITEPGKYGLHLVNTTEHSFVYDVYAIKE